MIIVHVDDRTSQDGLPCPVSWLVAPSPRRSEMIIIACPASSHVLVSRRPVVPPPRRPMLTLRPSLTSPLQLPEARRELWKWRPGRGDPEHTGRGGPPPKDIADLPGWRHDDEEPSSTETEVVSGVGPTETA